MMVGGVGLRERLGERTCVPATSLFCQLVLVDVVRARVLRTTVSVTKGMGIAAVGPAGAACGLAGEALC